MRTTSLDVEVKITGQLENPRNRDLAEHVVKLVREAVERAAADTPGSTITVGDPWERLARTWSRRFDGFDEFGTNHIEAREVTAHHYVHLPPPAPEVKES